MKPLKLSIKVDATDHFIYNGRLYIALSDGGIITVGLNKIFEVIKEKYTEISGIDGILNLSFKRNLYWKTQPVKSFINIPDVRESLLTLWNRISQESPFEVDISDLDYDVILKNIPSEILDISIYGQAMYLACLNGLYQIDLDRTTGKSRKKFDAKTYSINTGYCHIILSLGSDGISRFNPFEEKHVKDSSNRKGESISTRWTPAGGLMNYLDTSTLEFLSNEIVKLDKDSNRDMYTISSFAISSNFIDSYIRNSDKELYLSRVLAFNGTNRQYALTGDGTILYGELSVKKGKLSSIGLTKLTEVTDEDYGEAISGCEVAGSPVVEFDNLVCLFQDNEKYIIEDEPVISIHTYPRSSHFRDIVSVTTENYINIHSIDVLSQPCPDVHPYINRHKSDSNQGDFILGPSNQDSSNKIDLDSNYPF